MTPRRANISGFSLKIHQSHVHSTGWRIEAQTCALTAIKNTSELELDVKSRTEEVNSHLATKEEVDNLAFGGMRRGRQIDNRLVTIFW